MIRKGLERQDFLGGIFGREILREKKYRYEKKKKNVDTYLTLKKIVTYFCKEIIIIKKI